MSLLEPLFKLDAKSDSDIMACTGSCFYLIVTKSMAQSRALVMIGGENCPTWNDNHQNGRERIEKGRGKYSYLGKTSEG